MVVAPRRRVVPALALAGVGLLLVGCQGQPGPDARPQPGPGASSSAPRSGPSNAPGGPPVVSPTIPTPAPMTSFTEKPATPADLPGAWLAVEGTPTGPVSGREPRMVFTPSELQVQTGCNPLGGAYRLEGQRMRVELRPTTRLGCDPALTAQEKWLNDLLQAGPTWKLEGGRLELTTGQVSAVLVRAPDMAQPT